MTTVTPNRGGAPIGNQNARKHGLYSERPAVPLPGAPPDITADIANLREYMQRFADSAAGFTTPQDLAFVIRHLTVASLGLARLIRTQLFANPPDPKRDALQEEIGRIAEEVRQQWEPDGRVICPNCQNTTSLLSLARLAAEAEIDGHPHLDFAVTRDKQLVPIPEYQDELARCLGQEFADRQVIPRPDLSIEQLDNISAQYHLAHPNDPLPTPAGWVNTLNGWVQTPAASEPPPQEPPPPSLAFAALMSASSQAPDPAPLDAAPFVEDEDEDAYLYDDDALGDEPVEYPPHLYPNGPTPYELEMQQKLARPLFDGSGFQTPPASLLRQRQTPAPDRASMPDRVPVPTGWVPAPTGWAPVPVHPRQGDRVPAPDRAFVPDRVSVPTGWAPVSAPAAETRRARAFPKRKNPRRRPARIAPKPSATRPGDRSP
jgi:hypothetical protein